MATTTNRRPDYKLKAFNKVTSKKLGEVGAGWLNENGSITIVLDTFVVLSQRDDVVFTLFPTLIETNKV